MKYLTYTIESHRYIPDTYIIFTDYYVGKVSSLEFISLKEVFNSCKEKNLQRLLYQSKWGAANIDINTFNVGIFVSILELE